MMCQRNRKVLPSVSAYPGPLVPEVFQGTLLVFAEPPFAELHLQQEGEYADEQAHGVAAVGGEV